MNEITKIILKNSLRGYLTQWDKDFTDLTSEEIHIFQKIYENVQQLVCKMGDRIRATESPINFDSDYDIAYVTKTRKFNSIQDIKNIGYILDQVRLPLYIAIYQIYPSNPKNLKEIHIRYAIVSHKNYYFKGTSISEIMCQMQNHNLIGKQFCYGMPNGEQQYMRVIHYNGQIITNKQLKQARQEVLLQLITLSYRQNKRDVIYCPKLVTSLVGQCDKIVKIPITIVIQEELNETINL